MIKAVAQMKHVVDGKEGVFSLDNDTPFPAAKEMCLAFLKYLSQAEDAAEAHKKALAEKEAAEEKKEEPCSSDCQH